MEITELEIQERVQQSHWWYVGRRRMLDDLLHEIADQRGEVRFAAACDVGAGVGSHLPVLRRHARHVVAADVSPVSLEYCEQKGYDATTLAPLEELPQRLAGERIDLVIAMDVLEHLDDDAAGARSIFQILQPGGWAVVTVPAFQLLWGLQDEVSHHRRRYRLPDLRALLEGAGLKVELATYCNSLLFLPILLARLLMRIYRPRGLKSENAINSPAVNSVLERIFLAECALLRRGWRFPAGVSVLAVARGELPERNSSPAGPSGRCRAREQPASRSSTIVLNRPLS